MGQLNHPLNSFRISATPLMKYVPYYRVSTAGQGKSGLGLSAQREIVHRFLKAGDELLGEFVGSSRASVPTGPSWQQPLPRPSSREPGS